MHIHYNTNQTTLPLEISYFLPQDHLVFTIEKVVNTLEDSHFHAFYHAFGRPSYHPKILGICSSICLFTRDFLWSKN